MLLHDILDEEVDTAPPPEQALLPVALDFLSSFPQYLDIIVQCTRKTEVRSWRTLFAHLPPPQVLFEESLQQGSLKTAGGYLLVLHTFESLTRSSEQLLRLLRRAKDERDWELCKELARFLMALDETGNTLREAMETVELKSPSDERAGRPSFFMGPGAATTAFTGEMRMSSTIANRTAERSARRSTNSGREQAGLGISSSGSVGDHSSGSESSSSRDGGDYFSSRIDGSATGVGG